MEPIRRRGRDGTRVLSADNIAQALGRHKVGAGRMARYAAHNDCNLTLSIEDADHAKSWCATIPGRDQLQMIATLRACGGEVGDGQ
jgi:hypothetical protein